MRVKGSPSEGTLSTPLEAMSIVHYPMHEIPGLGIASDGSRKSKMHRRLETVAGLRATESKHPKVRSRQFNALQRRQNFCMTTLLTVRWLTHCFRKEMVRISIIQNRSSQASVQEDKPNSLTDAGWISINTR